MSWWRWWRTLPQNPVYLREKGGWGKPNPFYDTLGRYSPFVVSGAILLGACASISNPALFAGSDALLAFYCLVCMPGILLNTVSMFGSLMAPALTAPSISMEMDRQTWDILRVTPLSTRSIVMAKLIGGLSRLRIWSVLFVLSVLHGLIMACSATFTGGSMAAWGLLIGASTAVRPWLEVPFAAVVGMVASTRVHSARTALAASYTVVAMVRILNSSGLWLGIFSLFDLDDMLLVAASAGPVFVYILLLAGFGLTLMHQADRLESV
ncbi:MAG: hypothetical protein ACE5E7_18120 [Anaerolineae bacterium]